MSDPLTAGLELLHVAVYPAGAHTWHKPSGAYLVEVVLVEVAQAGPHLIVATFGRPQ